MLHFLLWVVVVGFILMILYPFENVKTDVKFKYEK